MRYRSLGNSNLQVPEVSFGAWAIGGWMWGGTDDAAAVRAIQGGIDTGMTCIDTAPSYGMGHSERIVGEAIAGRREAVVLATKCGIRWDHAEGLYRFETRDNAGTTVQIFQCLKPHSIRTECEQSLKRLRTDYIDLYQIHWPDPTTPLEESMAALMDLRAQGKIRHIGVSNLSPEQMDQCRAAGVIVSAQPPFNALEQGASRDILPYCRKHDLGALAYSPLAQGLLTGKVDPGREFPAGDARAGKQLFTQENRMRVLNMLDAVRGIADGHSATLGQLFLAWTVAQPGVTTVLAGARTPEQAVENAGAGSLELSGEDLKAIDAAIARFWRV